MITREQAEQQLGLGKYAKQQIEEQINALKAEREQVSDKIDVFYQFLEKNGNLSVSIKQEAESLRKELGNLSQMMDDKISEIRETQIKPDFSHFNKLYEEKTEENIKRLNSRLKVPNLAIYLYIILPFFVAVPALMLWDAMKSKQEIIDDYHTKLLENNELVSKNKLAEVKKIYQWLRENPKESRKFQNWMNRKQTQEQKKEPILGAFGK